MIILSDTFSQFAAPLLRQLRVRYLERDEYLPLDPRMISFFNINYPEDLNRANVIAAQLEAARAASRAD